MKVLVLNCGSSSIKYQVLQMPDETLIIKGIIERIGEIDSIVEAKNAHHKIKEIMAVKSHTEGIEQVLQMIVRPEFKALESVNEIGAIGHRIVHGGEKFSASTELTDSAIKAVEENIPLAPLHNPANLKGIVACKQVLPKVPQIGVFDTAFHQGLPKYAYLYAIPNEYYEKYGIRRYGFHGTSHKYVAQRTAEMLGKPIEDTRIVTAHLGNGASVTAVKGGRSIDTSMGFTPLEGLIMGTRSGDLDPAILCFLQKNEGMSSEDIDVLLNKRSGIIGLYGKSNDMRPIEDGYFAKKELETLIMTMYSYRLAKYIGSYMAVMGGIDALTYTAGVGENTPPLRYIIAEFMKGLGFGIDEELNLKVIRYGKEVDISSEDATVKTFVIPTNEELAIARDTYSLVTGV